MAGLDTVLQISVYTSQIVGGRTLHSTAHKKNVQHLLHTIL